MDHKFIFIILVTLNSAAIFYILQQYENKSSLDLTTRPIRPHSLPKMPESVDEFSTTESLSERPIFHESRQPYVPPKKIIRAPVEITNNKPSHLSLTGIIYKPNGKSIALFVETETAKRIKLRVDQLDRNWQVKTITQDSVVLFNQENTYTFFLRKQ